MILKGGNRRSFEQRLEHAVRRRIARYGDFHVVSRQSVVFVEPRDENADVAAAFDALRDVFGIVSLSIARECEKSIPAIIATAREQLNAELSAARSFKVETRRADKRFPMSSVAVSQAVGGELSELFPNAKPDMHTPEFTVNVEIREDSAFVHASPTRGAGGLPPGTSGRAVALLSGGIDSPVACYLAAKRGLKIIPAHFWSYPYTSELAKQKVLDISKILTRYCGDITVEVVPFTKVQEEIGRVCPEEFGTIITRRFMTRIAEKIAYRVGADALVTGENLGQVASQTLKSLAATEDAATIPILRPLITGDKREIVELAVKIGTFDTSILPYEDCCTVFTPRHPATQPRIDRVREAESKLDVQALVDEAYAGIERIRIEH
jgi:thiamine biosynthesis protein ThiI